MQLVALIVRRLCPLAIVLLGAVLAAPAGAVVISQNSDAANLVAPANDPGWLNVGHVGGASGVYVGNRWVITANHVGSNSLRLSDGRTFDAAFDSSVRLSNPSGLELFSPDLRMFRLAEDPGLPTLSIAATFAQFGDNVTMIGAGRDRAAPLIGWQRTSPDWTPVPLQQANAVGYELVSTSQMRWGANRVSSETTLRSDATFGFLTTFDSNDSLYKVPFEAQGASGDSGGGAFRFVGGKWELSGIITATLSSTNQPSNAVVFGNQTQIADLSFYRGQILQMLNQVDPLWQNPANRYDVSRSGGIDTHDLLLLVNELLASGSHPLDGSPGASDWFFDINGDDAVSPSDAQQLVNRILSGTTSASFAAEPLTRASGVNFVPEPSGFVLAGGGFLLSVLAGWAARRRKKRDAARAASCAP